MSERSAAEDERFWRQLVDRVRDELSALPADQRHWLETRLRRIAELQTRLHGLFLGAGGPALCAACDGACCDCGRNHLTLGNLAALLLAGSAPPPTDFTAPCPFLAPAGCRLEPAQRPFNCVSFLCEAVEARLNADGAREFNALEAELRACYGELAQRYLGAGPYGLLLRAERLGGRSFFDRP